MLHTLSLFDVEFANEEAYVENINALPRSLHTLDLSQSWLTEYDFLDVDDEALGNLSLHTLDIRGRQSVTETKRKSFSDVGRGSSGRFADADGGAVFLRTLGLSVYLHTLHLGAKVNGKWLKRITLLFY